MCYKMQSFPYEKHCGECYKKLTLKLWPCYLHLSIFTFTYTLLVCDKIKSCCDHRFPQQIRPQNTAQLYILRDYSSGTIGFNMKNKRHSLPVVYTILV